MRQCPSPRGNSHPLITHRIDASTCMGRQREFYHKCHRCEFAGKPADFCLDEHGMNGVDHGSNNGVPTQDLMPRVVAAEEEAAS